MVQWCTATGSVNLYLNKSAKGKVSFPAEELHKNEKPRSQSGCELLNVFHLMLPKQQKTNDRSSMSSPLLLVLLPLLPRRAVRELISSL